MTTRKVGQRDLKQSIHAVQTLDTVSGKLKRERGRLLSWHAVASEFGISTGTCIRVASGYEPKRADIRAALGLPCYVPAPVCGKCGRLHEMLKQCAPRKPRTVPAAPRRNWKRLSLWLAGVIAYGKL